MIVLLHCRNTLNHRRLTQVFSCLCLSPGWKWKFTSRKVASPVPYVLYKNLILKTEPNSAWKIIQRHTHTCHCHIPITLCNKKTTSDKNKINTDTWMKELTTILLHLSDILRSDKQNICSVLLWKCDIGKYNSSFLIEAEEKNSCRCILNRDRTTQ